MPESAKQVLKAKIMKALVQDNLVKMLGAHHLAEEEAIEKMAADSNISATHIVQEVNDECSDNDDDGLSKSNLNDSGILNQLNNSNNLRPQSFKKMRPVEVKASEVTEEIVELH